MVFFDALPIRKGLFEKLSAELLILPAEKPVLDRFENGFLAGTDEQHSDCYFRTICGFAFDLSGPHAAVKVKAGGSFPHFHQLD